jgi:hypothetical protein
VERFDAETETKKRKINSMKIKTALTCVLALMAIGVARASDFTITGGTTGTFTVGGLSTYGHLTFTNGSFSDTTAGGFAAIGGTAGNNLGNFALAAGTFTYNSAFTLVVTFTAPPGAGGGSYTASVTGIVHTVAGGVLIDFNNTPQTFTFPGGGSFTLTVNDTSVSVGSNSFVTGQITGANVPDGGSAVTLLGIALAGIEGARRIFRARKA